MTKQEKRVKSSSTKKVLPLFLMKRINEGCFILALTGALFLLLSLSTYQSSDPGWFQGHHPTYPVNNAGGKVGAYLADALYFLFGYCSFFIPLGAVYIAWLIVREHRALRLIDKPAFFLRLSGFVFFMISACSLLSLDHLSAALPGMARGGILGEFVADGFEYALNMQGSLLLLSAIFLVGITCLTGLSWVKATELIGCYTLKLFPLIKHSLLFLSKKITLLANYFAGYESPVTTIEPLISLEPLASIKEESPTEKPQKDKPLVLIPSPSVPTLAPLAVLAPDRIAVAPVKTVRSKRVTTGMPELSLLDKSLPGKPMGGFTHQELENVSRDVEQHLLDFGVHADVVAVHPGPVITRFELQLAAGIKVSKLSALAKDLARSLSVISVRVVEVIPGKTVVGLELPNQHREMVRLYDVLSADVYQQALSPLTLALGVDIAGHPMVVDLAKMPHLLVAGTTGSGKSVGINAMILSLLFKATPEQVRLIMIDPKMLELSVYDGIPHLLTPVVTDMKEAASALRWCVAEMERRYKLMSATGVRNLAGFNNKVNEAIANQSPLVDPLWKPISGLEDSAPLLQPLPYVVVVIDELADMMMVVGKKVEQLIARIAQKARAAGIHLILATQRPSVDVLTGLIKSNIPTRISFQVSSKIDSRTILDQQGAEQLLGHGDMLYLAPGTGAPLRVHGAYVDDKEVHRIADDWRARGEPNYIDEITQQLDLSETGSMDEDQQTEETDPLYDQAVEFVLQTRKASISAVQRRLKIGYNRAARLIEEMERTGLVGPLDGGYRDVLVTTANEE